MNNYDPVLEHSLMEREHKENKFLYGQQKRTMDLEDVRSPPIPIPRIEIATLKERFEEEWTELREQQKERRQQEREFSGKFHINF